MFNLTPLQTRSATPSNLAVLAEATTSPTVNSSNSRDPRRWVLNSGLFTSVSSNVFRGTNLNFGRVNIGAYNILNYRINGQALQLNLGARLAYPYDATQFFPPNSWNISAGLQGLVPLSSSRNFSLFWSGRALVNEFNPRHSFKPPRGPSITSQATVLDIGAEIAVGVQTRLSTQGLYSPQNPLAIQAQVTFAVLASLLSSTAFVESNGSMRGLLLDGDRFPTDVNTTGLAWRAALQVVIPCGLPLGPLCLGTNLDFQFERADYSIVRRWSTATGNHTAQATLIRVNFNGGLHAQFRF